MINMQEIAEAPIFPILLSSPLPCLFLLFLSLFLLLLSLPLSFLKKLWPFQNKGGIQCSCCAPAIQESHVTMAIAAQGRIAEQL